MRMQMSEPFFFHFFVFCFFDILPILLFNELNQIFIQIIITILDGVEDLVKYFLHFLTFRIRPFLFKIFFYLQHRIVGNFFIIDVFKFCSQLNETLFGCLNASSQFFDMDCYRLFHFVQFFCCQLCNIDEMLMLLTVALLDFVEFLNRHKLIDPVKGMIPVVQNTLCAQKHLFLT